MAKSNDRIRYGAELQAVINVIKKRFPNLTTNQSIEIASEILVALDETIDL